jgi:predicted oxidoreductase
MGKSDESSATALKQNRACVKSWFCRKRRASSSGADRLRAAGSLRTSRSSICQHLSRAAWKRRTNYVDLLAFHRPDRWSNPKRSLAPPNTAQKRLVRYFGVSKPQPHAIELLKNT